MTNTRQADRQASDEPSYKCPICGMISYHPRDIEHGYCGRCHAFTAAKEATNVQHEPGS
jgi:ribosomal protein S27AE